MRLSSCFFSNIFFPVMTVIKIYFSHGIIWSGVHFTFCWGCHWVSRQGLGGHLLVPIIETSHEKGKEGFKLGDMCSVLRH